MFTPSGDFHVVTGNAEGIPFRDSMAMRVFWSRAEDTMIEDCLKGR